MIKPKSKFTKEIVESLLNDKKAMKELSDNIVKSYSMTEEELQSEIKRLKKKNKKLERELFGEA